MTITCIDPQQLVHRVNLQEQKIIRLVGHVGTGGSRMRGAAEGQAFDLLAVEKEKGPY